MSSIIKACKPLDLLIILLAQLFTTYFLGFGNSISIIFDSTHLSIYGATLFSAIFGHLFLAWNQPSLYASNLSENNPFKYLVLSLFSLLLCLTIAYLHSLKLGNIFAVFVLLYFFNGLFFKKLPLIGTLTMALISGGAIFVLLPFDANLKSKLILIYSLYFFGIQFIRESLGDIINEEEDSRSGFYTLPVIAGIKVSRLFTLFFVFVFILLITTGVRLIMLHYFTAPLSYLFLTYNLVCIGVPLFHLLSRLQVITEIEEYKYLKDVSSYAMLTMVFSMLFF